MTQTISLDPEGTSPDIPAISDRTADIFARVVVVGLCQAVDCCGVVTNIINIMCFVKQGFKEPINVSLLGLAISDLGCLATQMCINTLYVFIVGVPAFHFDALDLVYLAGVIPHLAFCRVNTWITAIITLERCLCVTIPLRLKHIVTTERMWFLISCVYVVFLFSGAPVYAVNRLGRKFSKTTNMTVLGLVSTADKDKVEGLTFAVNSFLIPFIAFILIIVSTIILVVNLRKKTSWRKAATQWDLSTREQKVVKMVVMISTLFIVCFVPVSANMLAVAFEPRLHIGGKFINISKVTGNIGLLLESVNSTANIFIYYHMSRKYRDTFRSLFQKYVDISNSSN